jgi:hypothetical protein
MACIDLAQDRGQRKAFVNTVMKFRVPAQLAASQEGLSFMKLVSLLVQGLIISAISQLQERNQVRKNGRL